MSRSYKKTPIIKDGKSGYLGKKFANKTVRKIKGYISNGSFYKKYYSSYDIHDYTFRCTYNKHKLCFEEDLKSFLHGGSPIDPREIPRRDDNHWAKYYKRK